MNKKLALAGVVLAAIGISILTKKEPPTPPGVMHFTIKVANLPAEATEWGCAFQNTETLEYYQPTNRHETGTMFLAEDSAEFSIPVSSGALSISAFNIQVTPLIIQIIVHYLINMTVANNGVYTIDFLTGNII